MLDQSLLPTPYSMTKVIFKWVCMVETYTERSFFFFRIIGICYASHGEKHVFKFCFKQKLGYSRSPPTTGFDRKTVTFNAKCFAQRTIYVHFFFFQNERTCVFPFAVHRIQTKDCSSESLEDFGHFIQDTTGMRYASNYLTLRCSFRIKGHDVNC
jgi:hypothetical protein